MLSYTNGYTFCILLITLLRLAELIILHHQSTWTMPIVNAICGIGKFANKAKTYSSLFIGIIYQCLPSGDEIALPVHSINDRHDASIFCKLHVLFREWMPMVDSLYKNMVVCVESRWKIIL